MSFLQSRSVVLHKKILFCGVLFCAALFVDPLSAESIPSQITIDRGGDSNGGRDYSLALELGFKDIQLGFNYGESETRQDDVARQTESAGISISSNPLSQYVVAASYSEREQLNAIEIQTLRLDFILNTDDWRFIVAPQQRQINLPCSVQLQGLYPLLEARLEQYCQANPTIDIESDGINLGMAFYGADPWYVSIDYSKHDYSRDIAYLASGTAYAGLLQLFLSPSSLDHTFGLEDEGISGDLGYAFEKVTLGIAASRSVSAVDSSVSTSKSIYFISSLDKHWQLNLEGGVSKHSLSDEKTRFGVISLGYSW